jgi:hypothetical protein
MTDTVREMLGSPAWWFSTIAVALVVNLFSALIYDLLKQWTPSLTVRRLYRATQVVFAGLFLASCFLIAPPETWAGKMAPWLGTVLVFGVILDLILSTRYSFIPIVASVIVFLLSVFFEIIFKPPKEYSLHWVSIQFFSAVLVGVGVSIMVTSVLRIRDSRRRLRDYRG